MAFNIFSTLNQNLQNFGGDAYDAYQAGKSKVGNVASTINNNLQDFGGDIYDVGSTIKKNVSNFGTQTYNQGKQAVNQIQSNVSQFGTDVSNKASSVKKSILAPADRFMTDVTKIGNARKATQYGISEKDKSALMNQMLDAGQYSDDEIIQAVAQLDAEEKARKQKEFSDWEKGIRENASTTGKILGGSVEILGGASAGMMRLPAGVTDFVTGGTDYTKDTLKGINDFTSRSGAAKVGDIAGQIASTALIPGVGRIAPSGTSLAATAGRGAVYGGAFGGLTPIMEKGSEATGSDIGYGALGGAAMGAVAGPLLEKVVAPAIGKVAQSTTSGLKAAKFTQGSISDKIGAGLQASGKNISRGVKSIPMGGETLTRNIPKAIVKRDLGFTPTQRAKIENITGGDEAQYILKKGLAGKPKEELAEIFMKQSDDAYNGITTKLAKIDKTVKSTSADEALQDILDQLNSSPKIQRAYAKDIAGVENMLKKGEYTLSELNNIRRAYDKVNTGMFTVQGKARSGLENDIDVKVRRGLSDQLQKEAKKFGVDVKGMNTELRAGLEMKDALLSRLSQEERNNFLGLQDLGVSAILSGGEPVSAVATIAAKKYAEKVAPGLAQKAYNLNKNPNVTRRVSRGNTITPRNKSSGLGLASSTSNPMVSDSVKPPIVPKAKPKATTESAFKNNKGFINPSEIKKSLIPKKGVDEARQFYDDLVYAGNSPIVAQRETAKRFGTIRAMSASKAGTFGGEGAKEAPKTGWFKGADGKMKFEIDDSKASVNFDKIIPENISNRTKLGELQIRKSEIEKLATSVSQSDKPKLLEEYNNVKEKIKNIETNPGKDFGNYEVKLSDVLKHDELFKQYPNVKEIIVQPTTNIGESGSYVANSNTIKVSVLELNNPEKLKSTLLHEIQHAIQNKEGFARGGNPESFKQGIEYYKKLADYNRDILGDIRYDKMLEKDKTSIAYKKLVKEEEEALRTYKIANEKYKELSSTSPMESYNNQAGEVESRNVQTRMNMTAKERALKSPRSTEDVPRSKQIVRTDNKVVPNKK